MPHCAILAGPNGAGKSTAAPHLVHSVLGIAEFVNADVIARGLAGNGTGAVAVRAGRLMLGRLHDLAAQRADFAFETNLASRSWAPFIRTLQKDGYVVSLSFFALPTPEAALARVASRVLQGGHDVEEQVVRRRFESGRRLFFELYRELVDDWRVYEGSLSPPATIAEGRRGQPPLVLRAAAWKDFEAA